MVEYHYDWRHLVQEILFSGPNPLIHAAVSGLGHPLIHLGYAMEFDNREVAIEALSLIACFYSDIHKYLDDPQWTRPDRRPPWTSTSLFEILDRVRSDRRFDDLFDQPGADNVTRLFREKEPELMEWWNAWDLSPEGSPDVSARFEESQRLATALLVGSVDAEKGRGYDFFLVHTLTTSHAVRILLPLIPPEFQLSLVKEWWLFILAVFIAQLRPAIDTNRIKRFDLGNQSWTNVVVPRALQGEFRTDPHFVKGCRAMKEAAATWGDEDRYFEKAAVLFATEFTGWGGFTATGSRHAEEIPDI
ncbi:hypothetical protein P152DRAFT_461999 [Eremomyces bilateralis CBS 781.70]|uniref:Uncharacterized protein n=1 Tax=Eremomyces bilateralis CBS 781.70 TaxID=1392243 RepID=A0A6G1FTG3_9PEZI|nr:uncharacterized protein P152DRAFT_461999 [Eremomyces bilateralis CBS 781.70]KAF1808951.1 hypothetical protein P152DRAFT_461999 [Eremomyces bilateralis CBS 781.70]